MRKVEERGLPVPVLLLLGASLLLCLGCAEETDEAAGGWVNAKQVSSKHQLIGGPSARGKIGDFLIENDKVRFIIAGKGQSWMGGVFGGSLVDADLQRWWPEFKYGKGWDSFAETFPLVNMLVANPELAKSLLGSEDGELKLKLIPSGIEVVDDGSMGGSAVVRVTGRVGYMFETIKFLNKDFLLGYLGQPLSLDSFGIPIELPVDELLNMFLGVNVYALINRLQIDFVFQNDYILEAGKSYLTLRTTITSSPPTERMMERCPKAPECHKDHNECPYGFALREFEYEIPEQSTPTPGKVLCPICECAEKTEEMLSLNESEDIFQIMLGGLDGWRDPAWKGGLLGGDFLFFGSEANIFSPGLGFDENRRIFENMWQQVPTLANPLTFPWVAGVANNVSYGWFTKNPDRRTGVDCPAYRLALTKFGYDQEKAVVEVLVKKLGLSKNAAESRARHVVVDGKPLVLKEYENLAAGPQKFEDWKKKTIALATLEVPAEEPEEPGKTDHILASDLFPEGVELDLIPATECLDSKILIPIFSTSATAVMTHKSASSMEIVDGKPTDNRRTYSFTRYLVVGEGDVGSVLEVVYDEKGYPTGTVSGLVLDAETLAPVDHASVFAIRDPRPSPDDPAPQTYDALVKACLEEFGNQGIVSQMQSDLGLDPVLNGDYSGPLLPGRYFLVAFTKGRGVSRPVPITMKEGGHEIVHLAIPPTGEVHYVVRDEQGQLLPSRLSFIALNDEGKPMKWDGKNRVELGGTRYDQGVYYAEHSASGGGTVSLPAGSYEVYVSRGFEYSISHIPKFDVEGGQSVPLQALLVHEIDTTGYISADFHVHCQPSIDSSLPLELRIRANAAEGVEFITSTDHDFLTDYTPYINELGLNTFVNSAVGVETTTLEFGHYNGFPMEYDNTDVPVHDPPPWYGYSLQKVWEMMAERVDESADPDSFVVQVNHPRDGFMGYFSQLGLKGYNLQRSTPAMEMCNPQTEKIPCDFQAVELMNEKRFELLRTPTVAEKHMHNDCFNQIMEATSAGVVMGAFDVDPADVACWDLRQPPHDNCDTIDQEISGSKKTGLELAAQYAVRDHCRWHEEFAAEISDCSEAQGLIICKKLALDALKLLTVRYMMEKTPREQAAYFGMTPELEVGCDYGKAMAGCKANLNDQDMAVAGCGGGDCPCELCVCEYHPECCLNQGQEVEEEETKLLGTGWNEQCVEACRNECHGCGIQPCMSKQEVWEDWFSFLNHGFNVTAVGNSDSHNTKAEVGLPRNYVASSTDSVEIIDKDEIFRNVKEHRLIVSTGPFLYFSINGATVGDTLSEPGGDKLQVHINVQTASWFGVDRIEIYRNAALEQIIRIEPEPEEIVDFDEVLELDLPKQDSWYVVVAYGLDSKYLLSPVYKRTPLGKMLIPTIMAMGAKSILISFQPLLDEAQKQVPGIDINSAIGGLLGTEELPDSFPMFPLAFTNPIWVDLKGDGFEPPDGVDADGDGKWDLPPFCSQPCEVPKPEFDEEGNPLELENPCGDNQTCVPDSEGSTKGTCMIPIMDSCIGSQVDVGG